MWSSREASSQHAPPGCRAVAAGEMSDVVEPWRPWWLSEEAAELELSQRGTALVAEQQGK